jgi:hypothetical protein
MSPRWNWDSPTPLAASECALPPVPKGGGAHSPAAKGVGESQFQRLEKRLALCLLCGVHTPAIPLKCEEQIRRKPILVRVYPFRGSTIPKDLYSAKKNIASSKPNFSLQILCTVKNPKERIICPGSLSKRPFTACWYSLHSYFPPSRPPYCFPRANRGGGSHQILFLRGGWVGGGGGGWGEDGDSYGQTTKDF